MESQLSMSDPIQQGEGLSGRAAIEPAEACLGYASVDSTAKANAMIEIGQAFPDLALALERYLNGSQGEREQARLARAVEFSARLLLRQDILPPGQTCKSRRFTGRILTEWPKIRGALRAIAGSWTGPNLAAVFLQELKRSAKSLWHATQVRQAEANVPALAYPRQAETNTGSNMRVAEPAQAGAPVVVLPASDRRRFLELRSLQLEGRQRAFEQCLEQLLDRRCRFTLSRDYCEFVHRRNGRALMEEAQLLVGRVVSRLRVRTGRPVNRSISLAA